MSDPRATQPGTSAPARVETVKDADLTLTRPQGAEPAAPPPALPSVPGYELQSVLGRGGMGVVYLARQLSLKRLVALKVVSAGGHAGPEELARFRGEAEAAARLQHPNIVQIYEVGVYGALGAECPYMALEYVEGGSLARAARHDSPSPRRAAEVVATLARAVQHAHERGVIHRDVKPANVLLTRDGTPKVSDFGLAKQMEGASARTASGAVMGTPAYMAPEQAAGHTRAIGPATDVYGLGTVLYELLAARPPFAGESVLATLEQVRTRPPVPPSRLRPKVPRDLETICLKCLHKEPPQRYVTAGDLADDLDRFLAGESVRARREGPAARLWRQLRRRPRAAAVTAGVVTALALAAALVVHFRDSSRTAQQASQLHQTAIRAREAADDSADRVAEALRRIEELARVAPAAAADERELLAGRVEEVIGKRMQNGRLEPEDVDDVRAAIDRLAAFHGSRAERLRGALDERLRDWVPVIRLEGPDFAGRDAAFGPGGSEVRDGALEPRAAAAGDVVRTLRPSPGYGQVTASFPAGAWEAGPRVGVALSASPSHGGYAFVLSAGGGEPLGEACRKKHALRLQILRDGRVMREQPVDAAQVAGRALTLWAQRRGDALACQLNGRKPLLLFRDLFPIGPREGATFALVGPAGVRLSALVGERLAQAAAPRPLERGDELYDQGLFEAAADFYRKEAAAGGASEIGQEARCKAALCLHELGRDDDAARLFEQVALGDAPQWAALADCQLWVRALDDKRAGRPGARAPRQRLAARGLPVDQLAALMPDELRARLLRPARATPGTRLLAAPDPDDLENLRDAATALRLLEPERNARAALGLNLIKGFRLAGRDDEALALAQDLLRDHRALDVEDMSHQLLEQTTWLLRSRGDAAGALALGRRYLGGEVNGPAELTLPVRLDCARDLALTGQAAAAEEDVDRVLKAFEGRAAQPAYAAQAWLVKGLLRARAGDAAGASAAWGRGADAYKASPARDADEGALTYLLDYWIVAALAGRLDDAEAAKLRARMMAQFAADPVTSIPIRIMGEAQPLDAYRRMWQTERGRKAAEQIALREAGYADALRLPLFLNVTTTLEMMALPGEPTAEQDRLVWDAVRASYAAYYDRTLGNAQLTQMVLAFQAARVPAADVRLPDGAALRGPLAYLFGLRYLKKANAKEAEAFFAEALKAPADAPAHRLAAKEMERLKGR